MLALAIIATVILGIITLIIFGASVAGEFETGQIIIIYITLLLLIFVIVTIWILYAR